MMGSSVIAVSPEYVSVLFNEPKLLKYARTPAVAASVAGFSALQRAEIAEILRSLASRNS